MFFLNKLYVSGRFLYVVLCELLDGYDYYVVKFKKFDCSGVDDFGV